jgi:hypothetical protein
MFAQDAAPAAPTLPGGATGGAVIAMSATVALCLVCWIGTKVSGWQWKQLVVGACLGVAGNATFIGDICRMLIGIGVKIFQSITAGFGL